MCALRSWVTRVTVMALLGLVVDYVRERPPEILLQATIDPTCSDRLRPYGYEMAQKSTFDLLAELNTVFDRASGMVPATLPAHVGNFIGLYPHGHGVRLNLQYKLPDEATTLAVILSDQDLQTVAVCLTAALHPRYGLAPAFLAKRTKWNLAESTRHTCTILREGSARQEKK